MAAWKSETASVCVRPSWCTMRRTPSSSLPACGWSPVHCSSIIPFHQTAIQAQRLLRYIANWPAQQECRKRRQRGDIWRRILMLTASYLPGSQIGNEQRGWIERNGYSMLDWIIRLSPFYWSCKLFSSVVQGPLICKFLCNCGSSPRKATTVKHWVGQLKIFLTFRSKAYKAWRSQKYLGF